MSVTNLSSALSTLSRVTEWGVLSRARGVRWIVAIWCLLFTVSVFSATHFPNDQAANDALETIETMVDDAPGEALPAAKPSKGFERVTKVAPNKAVEQPGQYFSVEHWVTHVSNTPDAPSTNAVVLDHLSDAPELWLPPPPMVLTSDLRVVRVRVALPSSQVGPTPAPMLCPPACA